MSANPIIVELRAALAASEAREAELLKRLVACGSHLIALGRLDLAPFGEQIICPRCEGQTYDVGACGLCRNIGWLNEQGEALS